MEALFKKIENNIFESQEKANLQTKTNLQDKTTDDSLDILKLVRHIPQSEVKNNFQMFKDIQIPNSQIDEQKKQEDEEYADYGRRNKTGIHFQVISDHNVSIEIVPEDILNAEMESLLEKYKAVFDPSLKLWLLPYVNYEPLYNDLIEIKNFKYKIYKIGSIAKKCHENKALTVLEIKRKVKEEKIDYTKDTMERNVDTLPKSIKNALYDFQFEGVKFGIEHHCRFLLADEMGVGKTIQAISLCYLYREDWPVLIVCPGSMKYLWKGEIQTWLGFKDKRIDILNSSKQKISDEAYFYIISYDLVSHILKKLKKMKFNFVILDEAHCIKNRETIRAKNILPIAIRAKRLILMTGTPLLAKPLEGYPLLYALRPDLFPYFKQYAYRYCDPQPTPFGVTWSGTSNTKELHWLLSTLMVRRLKKEVLNKLPPKRRQKVEIKTDPEIIEKIKEARVKIKGRNGTLQAYTLTSTAKKEGVCEYISDILSDSEEKIIVFAYHHEMMNCVEELLKKQNIDYIRIDGSTKQSDRYDFVRYFQQKKECRVAIVSIIAGSTGITLNKAHIVIFAELTWTPSIMIQAEDRAHRIGQKSNFVDIKYLYGPGTLDDFILDKLQKKLVIVSTTIDDKRENFGVQADPNLIYVQGKPKNSQELMKLNKGDFDLDNSSEDEKDNEVVGKKLEKQMMKELIENDPDLFINTGLSQKKDKYDINSIKSMEDINNIGDDFNLDLKAIQNIQSNNENKDNNESDSDKDNVEDYFDELDKMMFLNNQDFELDNNDINKNQENKEQEKDEKIILNDNLFNLANNNINEEINDIKYTNTETKLKKKQIKNNESNKKVIQYPKEKGKKTYYNNRKYNYPKENEDETDDLYFTLNENSNKHKNKKIKYPKKDKKRDKTPNSSHVNKHKKLPPVQEPKKRWSSINRNKKSNFSISQEKEEKNDNITTKENDFNAIINNNTDNNNKSNNDFFKEYEKNLMINLHDINMRRSSSQMETKQSQSSIYLDDNELKKAQTQTKRFLFTNDKDKDKEKINEGYNGNNNDKVKLIFN